MNRNSNAPSNPGENWVCPNCGTANTDCRCSLCGLQQGTGRRKTGRIRLLCIVLVLCLIAAAGACLYRTGILNRWVKTESSASETVAVFESAEPAPAFPDPSDA